jgi:tRNA wybutosine-synthesizing protein 1
MVQTAHSRDEEPFFWRSYSNPVSRSWKFETNPAKEVFEGFLENHRKLIVELRGVPGVDPERFANAQVPQHCALSLVGEALMYPEINELIDLLHGAGISTFLVTNEFRYQSLPPPYLTAEL